MEVGQLLVLECHYVWNTFISGDPNLLTDESNEDRPMFGDLELGPDAGVPGPENGRIRDPPLDAPKIFFRPRSLEQENVGGAESGLFFSKNSFSKNERSFLLRGMIVTLVHDCWGDGQ